jgi:phosphoserine phosphatase RsbU/P
LFTSMGLAFGMMSVVQTPVPWALAFAAISGVTAVGYAYLGFRALWKWLMLLVPVQFIGMTVFASFMGRHVDPLLVSVGDYGELQRRLVIEGFVTVPLIVLAYVLVVFFIRKEGARFFGQMAEVRLATEVHKALVPVISRRVGNFEIYGASMPNGQMGGDLVDVVQNDDEDKNQWMAYVADVCGHGVSAGMVMAMVKSATRMGSVAGAPMRGLLTDLNRVLAGVSAPNMFVTFACIAGDSGSTVNFSLAGHLPVLHYSKDSGTVQEHSVANLPLAISPETQFETSTIDCKDGDILAIITDGLTEAADKNGHEVGLEPLKAILQELAQAPLPDLMTALRGKALQQGKQVDDQTVLLVRRSARQN